MNLQQTIIPKHLATLIFLTAIILFGAAVKPIYAATFTVNTIADNPDGNPGDGICETGLTACSLRAAVGEANALTSNDTINFAASLSGATITLTVVNGGEIQILDNGTLNINGLGANLLTIDGGAGTNRIFYTRAFAQVTIRGVAMQGGNGTGTFASGIGGAIYANASSVVLDAVLVRNNSAQSGGGLYNFGTSRIINSTFTNNSAVDGGGIYNASFSTYIANTTISGNSATDSGGGIYNDGVGIIHNSTITLNTSATGGGGIFNRGNFYDVGNTIVAGNSAPTFPEIGNPISTSGFTSAGNNLIGDSAGDSTDTGNPITYQSSDIRDVPPQLGALANYGGRTPTHSLLVSSPAVNVGSNALAVDPFDNTPLSFDQRGVGFPRIVNSMVDIGAFEANYGGFIVNTVADTFDLIPGNGICADFSGNCSLRAAIQESNVLAGNQTINFSPALLGLTITLDAAKGSLNITTNVVINGLGADSIFVSGGDAVRVFNITGGTVNINRLTARNGNAGSLLDGGGIYSNGAALTLDNVIVRNSTATYGGGIYVRGGSLNMTTSSVSDNDTTDDGGGMLLVDVPSANITNSNIVGNNIAGSVDQILGGGIYIFNSMVTLTAVNILNNHANTASGATYGGGMSVTNGSIAVINCTVAGNTAEDDGGGAEFSGGSGSHRISGTTFSGNNVSGLGGGFFMRGGTVSAVNSTVSGNTAGGGGGIGKFFGTLTLRNVTVAGNMANVGGGIDHLNGSATLANTIVADNTASFNPDIEGVINSLGNNLVRTRGSSTGYVASDLPNGTNPLLGALANNGGATQTRALMPGSPAINAGNNAQALDTDNTTPLTTDQRSAGFARIFSGTTDIGAFEVQAPTPIVSGRVTYANAATTTGVPFTTINAVGSIPLSTTTDANGFYSINGFGSGAYTITPSKANQVNGISNLDASRIAQHLVGLTTLTANQLIAADTSGNGSVSSLDAAYIAQFVASIPNPSITGTWKFIPANRSYPNVMTNQTNQDYSAILVGDVTGNWNPTGVLGFDFSVLPNFQTAPADKRRQIIAIDARANQSAEEKTGLTVNLTASDTTGEGILSYQFDLLYNARVIEPQAVSCDVVETISRGMSAVCHAAEPGVLKVVVFGRTPIAGEGTLLKLKFELVGATGSTSPLSIENFRFNEDIPQEATIDGQVIVADSTADTVYIRHLSKIKT